MSFGQLVSLLFSSPELLAQLLAAVVALLVAIGGLGTALEQLGERFGWLWLVAIGQRLEAIGSDGPKAIRGSRLTRYQTDAVKSWGTGPTPPLLVLLVALACVSTTTACGGSLTPVERGALLKTGIVHNPKLACALYERDLQIPRDSEMAAACAALRECAGQ